MKVFLVFLLSLTSFVQAKECNLSLSEHDNSVLTLFVSKQSNRQLEIPDGKCKLVRDDFLREHTTCKAAFEAATIADKKIKKKYNCYQPAIGQVSGMKAGTPYTSIYEICYMCQTEKRFTSGKPLFPQSAAQL